MLLKILISAFLLFIVIPFSQASLSFDEKHYSSQEKLKKNNIQACPPVEKTKAKNKRKKRRKRVNKNKKIKREFNLNRAKESDFEIIDAFSIAGIIILILGIFFFSFGVGGFILGLVFLIVGNLMAITFSSFNLFSFYFKETALVITPFAITFLLNLIFSLILFLGVLSLTGVGILGWIFLGLTIGLVLVLIWFFIFQIAMYDLM